MSTNCNIQKHKLINKKDVNFHAFFVTVDVRGVKKTCYIYIFYIAQNKSFAKNNHGFFENLCHRVCIDMSIFEDSKWLIFEFLFII